MNKYIRRQTISFICFSFYRMTKSIPHARIRSFQLLWFPQKYLNDLVSAPPPPLENPKVPLYNVWHSQCCWLNASEKQSTTVQDEHLIIYRYSVLVMFTYKMKSIDKNIMLNDKSFTYFRGNQNQRPKTCPMSTQGIHFFSLDLMNDVAVGKALLFIYTLSFCLNFPSWVKWMRKNRKRCE